MSPAGSASPLSLMPALEDLALFRDIAGEDRHALAMAGETKRVVQAEVIIKHLGHHDSLFVILAGSFEVGREGKVLATLGAGQMCGEMEMLNPPHATADVTALSDSVVWRLSREHLRQFIESHPKSGKALMTLMAKTFAARL